MTDARTFDDPLPALRELARDDGRELTLRKLVDAGIASLPFPASGATLDRWRMLAEVAALDLSLAKLFEGHTDALAILHELEGPAPSEGSLWGTWCAEPPDARLRIISAGGSHVSLSGRKAWCSGAAEVTHALVSGWTDDGRPWLATVALQQAGVRVTDDGWPSVGMAASRSVDVLFDGAKAVAVGAPGDYVNRPGFWHGGAGIAACWFGGAAGIARDVRERNVGSRDPHFHAHLGAIETALSASAALLRESARWIDAHPSADAHSLALTLRLSVENAASAVVTHAARALGAGPLCRDARLSRAVADLPIYLRQSHAERDLEALGKLLTPSTASPWTL
ncbi:acyl-CoA dehydrogenase [Variovorax sp. Sphag1AA]|uniref:acyl-CoA dehydrogenase n=1 Tax=Variovorax sp. Sphag1AA TaxID=2587027 RepID=UPI0017F7DD07|nr:acyl-CoA dehydrogenase [Variovorax sp. Sphag1AA]MBB3178218.1 alkylation response protein AidB-like acyl-CoA dehydrogenase [Variovorax sp. Sphag1AA]